MMKRSVTFLRRRAFSLSLLSIFLFSNCGNDHEKPFPFSDQASLRLKAISSPIETLRERSDIIVDGMVVNVTGRYERNALGDRLIYSYVQVSVNEVLNNNVGTKILRSIVIRNVGGTVENITLKASHAPTFEVGERVVLFLTKRGLFWTPLGEQGKIRVALDKSVQIDELQLQFQELKGILRNGTTAH